MYKAVFKKSGWGFHAETFEASSDDEARTIAKAFQNKVKQDGNSYYELLSLMKSISLQ